MSKKQRHENDFYQTPARLTEELLSRVDISGAILEPCCGQNAIALVLSKQPNTSVIATDITDDGFGMPLDATKREYWDAWAANFKEYKGDRGIEWVVTNPPFNQAHLILPLAFEYCSFGVAFLLRSTYTEPCKNRRDWLIEHADNLRYRLDINPRPQFRKEKGTDSASCVWLVYLKNWSWQGIGVRSPFGYITDWRS